MITAPKSEDEQLQQKQPGSPTGVTRPYEYTESSETSPTRRYTAGGFRYDEDPELRPRDPESGQLSPNSQTRRATGLAFNYAPGEDDAVREQAEKRKTGELTPKSKVKDIDVVGPVKTSKSYSPNSGEKLQAEGAGTYRPITDDTTDAFLNNERDASQVPLIAPEAKKKRVKVLVIVSKFDPKNKRIDIINGKVDHSTGILNTETNKVETKFGVVDVKNATVEVLNTRTGKTETYQGTLEPKTGNIHITSGVCDPKTSEIDDSLGQIICIAPQDNPVIEITGIVGKLDANGNVDTVNATVERSRGVLNLNTNLIDTKYGLVNPRTGEVQVADSKSGKTSTKNGKLDPATGQITIAGAVDPKTGKYDQSLGQLVAFGSPIDPVVEVTAISGKLDKKGVIDPKSAFIENSTGQLNPNKKIDTKYGQIDLVKHTVTLSDPKSGKMETKDIKVDSNTGQILVKNCINPKTNKPDKDYAQVISLKVANRTLDNATGAVVPAAEGREVVVDPKTNKIWVAGLKDPKNNETIYSSSQVDPKTGTITIVYGFLNPKTNEVEKQTKADPNLYQIDDNGQIFTSTGERDQATNEPLFAATVVDPDSGVVVTKVAKVDKQTGRIIIVRLEPLEVRREVLVQRLEPPHQALVQQLPAKNERESTPPRAVETTTTTTVVTTTDKAKTPSPPTVRTSGVHKSVPDTTVAAGPTSIVPQRNTVLEVLTIVGKIDPNGKLDVANSNLERSRAIFNVQNGLLDTKYGQINLITKEIKTVTDTKTGSTTTKGITIDPVSGQILVIGVKDSKTNKEDTNAAYLITLGSEIDPIVEVTAISGKYDAKKNIIDPKTAVVESTVGQFDPNTYKISTTYGEFDIPSSTITYKHPKTQKLETKEVKVDAVTGQVILRNELNPKSGKLDKDYGRIVSLRIVNRKVDKRTGKVLEPAPTNKDIIVEPSTNQIWVPDSKDPITNETIYTSSQVCPRTGLVITLYGYLNPKTNEITRQTKVDSNITKVDETSGQIYTAIHELDETTGEPLYATSLVDEDSGELYTKVSRLDAKTGRLVLVKIILVTKKDERGVPKEIDASKCDVDAVTGRVQNIFNKTVYVYNMVDPVTGEIIQVDPNDPRVAGARTTVTQTMTLTGEIDPETGRIKTEYGHIHPETGDILPETAVTDPITGKLILNYAQIDPSHFGKEVTIVKETVPISRDQFYDGIKHLGTTVVRRVSEDASSDEDVAQYGDDAAARLNATGKFASPTVVKTTTKQVLTRNDDGVTHNVEEEIHNLGTGEIHYSSQEHKVCRNLHKIVILIHIVIDLFLRCKSKEKHYKFHKTITHYINFIRMEHFCLT